MPNKYYLREDRKAVTKEQYDSIKSERPNPGLYEDLLKYYDDFREWDQKLFDLPALDVDPDYLKRLSTGWFEGVEEYRITSTKGWVKTHKAMYDRFPDIQKQVLIVAPQPVAEKAGMRWVKASERLPQAGKPFFIRSVHTKSGGMMWGEEIGKMEELENVEWLDEQPATPQPVTGEAVEVVNMTTKEEFDYSEGQLQRLYEWLMDEKRKPAQTFFTAGWLRNVAKEIESKTKAASRPSDAVEFAEWVSGEGYVQYDDNTRWIAPHNNNTVYPTAELYQLFLNPNHLTQTNKL